MKTKASLALLYVSESIKTILDFFMYNEISPHERLGPTGRTIEASFKKRINAVIAIMRDMEKTQTKMQMFIIQTNKKIL